MSDIKPLRIALHSDFRDYYDHCFADRCQPADMTFTRLARDGMNRSTAHAFMVSSGLPVVNHGIVHSLAETLLLAFAGGGISHSNLASLIQVVVYTDPYAHAGNGKQLMTLQEAIVKAPNAYASEYIPSAAKGSVSWRILRIGKRVFLLRYLSHDDWRSNAGDSDIALVGEYTGEHGNYPSLIKNWRWPLVAVDFVEAAGKLFAIDLNTAPGLVGTGIERVMRPLEVYRAIEEGMTS